jgi:hypothetical protein
MARARTRQTVKPLPPGKIRDERGRVISPFVSDDREALPLGRVLPTPAEMRRMTKDQLWKVLRAYKVKGPWQQYLESQSKYLERVTRMSPGDPSFQAELDRILDAQNSEDAPRKLARATYRQLQVAEYSRGQPDTQLFIRITDTEVYASGQVSTCDECFARAGATGNLAFHEGIGKPGADSCLGGDRCNCQLVPIEFK